MTLPYLIERVTDLNATDVEIYHGNVAETRDLYPVFTIRENQDVVEQLNKFGKNFKGTFTALVRMKKNQEKKSGERIVFAVYPESSTGIQTTNFPINGVIKTEEQIREEIRKEFENKGRESLLEERLKMLEQQHAMNGMFENRLGNVLLHVGNNLGWFKAPDGFTAINAPINGTNNNQNTMSANYGPHDAEKLTESQEDQLAEHWDVIYSHLGLDLVAKVAAALQKDPSLANKLSLFI